MTKSTLLIVEDDEDIRTQMKWALASDYEVILAGDRAGAVAASLSENPTATLLDLGLPHLSGAAFRAVQRKMAPDVAAIPVVVVSGSENAVSEAERLGAVSCLRKPFTHSDIVRVVVEHTGFAVN